jgi:hypothetical protein
VVRASTYILHKQHSILQSGLLKPAKLLMVKILCRKKFFHLMFTQIQFVLVCRPVQNFSFALLNVHRSADAHAEQQRQSHEQSGLPLG